jgi:hypothetical protein
MVTGYGSHCHCIGTGQIIIAKDTMVDWSITCIGKFAVSCIRKLLQLAVVCATDG